MRVGGADFDFIAGFLSARAQMLVVDGIQSENVRVVFSVPQSSVLDLILFLLYTSDLSILLENTFLGYADDFFVSRSTRAR